MSMLNDLTFAVRIAYSERVVRIEKLEAALKLADDIQDLEIKALALSNIEEGTLEKLKEHLIRLENIAKANNITL